MVSPEAAELMPLPMVAKAVPIDVPAFESLPAFETNQDAIAYVLACIVPTQAADPWMMLRVNRSFCAMASGTAVRLVKVETVFAAVPAATVGNVPVKIDVPFFLMSNWNGTEASEALVTKMTLETAPILGEGRTGPTFVPTTPAPRGITYSTTERPPPIGT
jgi:hypothetical protein